MMLNHAHARTGRANDRRVAFGEGMHEAQRYRARLIFKTVVEERLSTTGLFGRKTQFHTELLQEAARHPLRILLAEDIVVNQKLAYSSGFQPCSTVKVPVALANRPVPAVIVAFSTTDNTPGAIGVACPVNWATSVAPSAAVNS